MAVRKAARVVPGPGPANYGHDVAAWSVEQARLLRAGLFDQLDAEHIAAADGARFPSDAVWPFAEVLREGWTPPGVSGP